MGVTPLHCSGDESLIAGIKIPVKPYQSHNTEVNETATENHLQRQFDVGDKKQIVVADLTYIQVKQRWNYLCVLVNLS
ncbi:MAG: hypothetical protein J6563_10270, partial [Gilliamella sp.]|nr:hypothetical protein [Gilliamella sp.]